MTEQIGKILVVGGAGYIGSHTVRMMVEQGYDLVVLDNLVYGHRSAIVDKSVTFIEGDLGDPDILEDLFSAHHIQAVIHFAAYAYVGESVTNPAKYYHNNVASPLVLLDAMLEHDCKTFIFSSTCATYGNPEYMPINEQHPQNPINPYGASKLMLERILSDYGIAHDLKSACLRYFNASGCSPDGVIGEDHDPETHLIPLVLDAALGRRDHITVFGTDYDTPDGSCIRDYIHILDLARAHILALEHLQKGNDSFKCNLGTGIGRSVKEVIAAAEEVAGCPVPVEFGERREGDPSELVADPSYAKELLGWEAEYKDLKNILQTAWNWSSGPNGGRYGD